jgi:hypothetical protein
MASDAVGLRGIKRTMTQQIFSTYEEINYDGSKMQNGRQTNTNKTFLLFIIIKF